MSADPNYELSAAEAAESFRSDEAAAAAILAEQLQPLVVRLVRQLSAWSSDCDDLVQDVLVTALLKRKTFDGRAKLETWITRITINRCRSHARKQWLRRKLLRAWAERRARTSPAAAVDQPQAEQDEQAAAVRTAVARLPQQSREAVALCYLQGMTVAMAAETLGVRRGTLEVRLTRARKQLHALLAADPAQSTSLASEVI